MCKIYETYWNYFYIHIDRFIFTVNCLLIFHFIFVTLFAYYFKFSIRIIIMNLLLIFLKHFLLSGLLVRGQKFNHYSIVFWNFLFVWRISHFIINPLFKLLLLYKNLNHIIILINLITPFYNLQYNVQNLAIFLFYN